MKKRNAAVIILAAFLLTGCGAVRGEISEEKTTVAQFTATAEKAPKIATEKPTEAQTEAATTATTEPETEEPTEAQDPEKILFVSERKTAERTAITTEETTGEINAEGYGWVCLQYSAPYHIMEDHLTRSNGKIRCFGHLETWYSTNEAAGKATAREIPGKHIADDGTIRDENGYICVASSDLEFYSIVMTSVGPGKVYDTGCSSGTIDVYTDW
jgi:hypothetical protein